MLIPSLKYVDRCTLNPFYKKCNLSKRKKKWKKKKKEENEHPQNKEDMNAAFLHCKDKSICEGKRKRKTKGLKMCGVCSNILHSKCDAPS